MANAEIIVVGLDEVDSIVDLFNEVFPDCEIVASVEDVLKTRCPDDRKFYRNKVANNITVYSAKTEPGRQPIYCNYHGRLRVVVDPICQYHLETFDPWCWERCKTEWSIKRLRPALSATYRQRKDSTPQKAASPIADGATRNLWE